MTDKYEDLESLATASTDLGKCAEDYATEVGELSRTVTSRNPWGADGPGTIFGLAYTEVVNQALEVYTARADELRYAATGVAGWSANSQANETVGTDRSALLSAGLMTTT